MSRKNPGIRSQEASFPGLLGRTHCLDGGLELLIPMFRGTTHELDVAV